MGQDAEQSRRGWKRHLRGLSRARAAKSGDHSNDSRVFFSPRELGALAINALEWTLYVVLTWGLIYLVFSDRMPKLAQAREPMYWLDASRSEPRSEPKADTQTCLAAVEEIAPAQESQELSPEFKKGFEAALQLTIERLEGKAQ